MEEFGQLAVRHVQQSQSRIVQIQTTYYELIHEPPLSGVLDGQKDIRCDFEPFQLLNRSVEPI
jgi:hypothetical protein